jgi:hypothetical protein
VGSETFAIRRVGEEYMAVGRVTIENGVESLSSVEIGLRSDRNLRPRKYELRALEGPRTNIAVSRSGNRLRLNTVNEAGERLTEFLAGPDLLLLERDVTHHYYFLIRRLQRESDPLGAVLKVLVPAEGRQVMLSVQAITPDSLRLGKSSWLATRYDVQLAEEAGSIWVDPDDGRVLRVAVPGRGWSATRIPKE